MADVVRVHRKLPMKPKAGTTVTWAQYVAAENEFGDRMRSDMYFWEPWNREAAEARVEELLSVLDQWAPADPNHRYLTAEEFEAQWEAGKPARDAEDEADRALYDADREALLRELLEEENQLALALAYNRVERQREAGMDPKLLALRARNREEKSRKGHKTFAGSVPDTDFDPQRQRIAELTGLVGDRETVRDSMGRTPAERRKANRGHFIYWRGTRVEELRKELEAAVEKPRANLLQQELDFLLALSPPTTEEMCSECERPRDWHQRPGVNTMMFFYKPCLSGPKAYRAAVEREEYLRRLWESWKAQDKLKADQEKAVAKAEAAAKKSRPYKRIPSGPMDVVMKKLAEAQSRWPNAEIRSGSNGSIELWPPERP